MTPSEARAYWRSHEQRFAEIDWERDPEGLAGYLGPGQPEWLNHRYAALQGDVFERLIARLPRPTESQRALDIGCGAGRWTRRLVRAGYSAVGMDLQASIIDANRERFPEIEWHALALQDLPTDRSFALVTSVAVLEAIPYVEQGAVVRRIAAVIAPGGHAILLAALHHPSANAFPHPVEGWAALFASAGLELEEHIPFGWEPVRRVAAAAVRTIAPSKSLTPDLPTAVAPLDAQRPGGAVWRAPAALRVAASVDDRLERPLQRFRPPGVRSRWSAFLFVRT